MFLLVAHLDIHVKEGANLVQDHVKCGTEPLPVGLQQYLGKFKIRIQKRIRNILRIWNPI